MSLEIYSMSMDREQALREAKLARTRMVRAALDDGAIPFAANHQGQPRAWQRALQAMATIAHHGFHARADAPAI
jgi:hypothetical protein